MILKCLMASVVSLALLLPQASWAAPTFVQGVICVSTAVQTTVSCTLPGSTTAGNVIVAATAYAVGTAEASITFNDDKGGTYTTARSILSAPAATEGGAIGTGTVGTPGTTIVTATGTANITQHILCALEYSGVNTASIVDVSASRGQTTPTTTANAVTSSTATTTADGEMIVGAHFDVENVNAIWTAGTSPNAFTDRGNVSAGVNLHGVCQEFLQTTAGSIESTATIDHGSNDTVSFMVALKTASTSRLRGTLLGVLP